MTASLINSPEISVIMPVYNGEIFIRDAIESILNQTYRNFEFIIINDGSFDKTQEIIESYPDSRIICLENKKNIGVANSRNRGLSIARGSYIAIMDADDISIPDRFSKQLVFLKGHPEVGVCGGGMKVIDRDGRKIKTRTPPTLHQVIHWALMFNCCIAQPTVMCKKAIIQDIGGYNSEFIPADDYDLWTRIIGHHKIANLSEFLLEYRMHGKNISKIYHEEIVSNSFKCSTQLIRATLGNQFNTELQSFFKKWSYGQQMSVEEIVRMEKFIERLSTVYQEIFPLNTKEKKELFHYQGFLLLDLAFHIKNVSRLKAFEYVLKAIRLDPSLLVQFPGKIRFARLYNNF